MPGQSNRQYVVAAIVIGILVVVLGAFLLIGAIQGDDTGEVDPQNSSLIAP